MNPPGEVVAELHSLPLRLLYELGVTGTALALAVVVLFVRRRQVANSASSAGVDSALARAGLAGLAGAGVALMGTAWLEVTALPVALAVAAGAALAGHSPETGAMRKGLPDLIRATATTASRVSLWAVAGARAAGMLVTAFALAAVVILLPLDRAQFAYDRAISAIGPVVQARALNTAIRLDPHFPIYRADLAWKLQLSPGGSRPVAVEAAHQAAVDGWGVAPFWLTAGVDGGGARAPWAAAALDRACDLDPLGALAPFYRMTLDPGAPEAATYGARALLAAPSLAAATWWEGREDLLTWAVEEVETWPGVDAGWRQAFTDAVLGWNPGVPATADRLALRVDPDGGASLPLRAFRRSPQPWRLIPAEIRRGLATQIRLPAATTLPTTSPLAFAGPGCGLPGASQPGGDGAPPAP